MEAFHNVIPNKNNFCCNVKTVTLDGIDNQYIIDNSKQDAVKIGYIIIDFSDISNNYASITDIIDFVELYYLSYDKKVLLTRMTGYNLLMEYDTIGYDKRQILYDTMLNFKMRCYIPLKFVDDPNCNYNNGQLVLPTPTNSPIKYVVRIKLKVDVKFDLMYDQFITDSPIYSSEFVQEYHEYKDIDLTEVTQVSKGIDKIVMNHPMVSDGIVIDLGSDGNVEKDVNKIVEIHHYGFTGPIDYKDVNPINYYIANYGLEYMDSRFVRLKHSALGHVVELNREIENIKILYFKKKSLKFIDGYLVRDSIKEKESRIQLELDQSGIFDSLELENDSVKLGVEI